MEEILNDDIFLNNEHIIRNDMEEDLCFAVYIVGLISIHLSDEQKDKFDYLSRSNQMKFIESLKLRQSTIHDMNIINVISLLNKYIKYYSHGD